MKRFSLRIEEDLLDRIKKVAKQENRSVNKQIMLLLRYYLESIRDTEILRKH